MKYLEICIKKSRLVELYCDHPPGVNLLESQASGCTQETSGQGLDGEEEEFVDSESEEDETEVDFSEDSEEDHLGYDNHLAETRDSDYEQSDDDIEVGDEVETPFNDLSKKYGKQAIGEEAGMSSMGNSSNAENVNTVRIDYRRKNLLPKLPEFRPDTDMAEPEFKVGLVFPDGKSFRAAVRQYSLRVGKQLWFKKNNSDKVRVQCRASDCPFVL